MQLRAGRFVCLELTDNGSGIPKKIIDKIFDPFFTTKEIGKGTGLGLSTVHAIVKSHGGIMTVNSEPDRGTTFKVYLPPAEKAGPAAGLAETQLPRGDGECVLVVDDEAALVSMAAQILESFGYRVLTATNGAMAVAKLAQYLPTVRVILTDMMMPIMDGPALIAAVRTIAPDLPIIAASGLKSNEGTAMAADSGVNHFLPKPYDTRQLLTMVHRILQEKKSAPGPTSSGRSG